MKFKIKVYSIQEFGQRKDSHGNPHQEDSMFPEAGKQSDSDRLFILCDGMGGHDAGEVASMTVCDAMSKSILNDGHDCEGVFDKKDFENALEAAYEALDEKDSGAEKKMGTTLTFLKLYEKGAFIAHMGDSRVYHIRPGKSGEDTKILHETSDHSLVNDLIKIGELSREEARMSKQKNVITRAMQPHMDRRPNADIYETADIRPGDYFYMCSDGMLEQAEMEDGTSIKNIFSERGGDDEKKVEILKSVTENNRDNHTAFIIHIIDVIEPIITAKANSSPLNDKFAAIVEDDDEVETTTESKKSNALETTKESTKLRKSDKNKNEGASTINRILHSNLYRFIFTAIIVAAVTIAYFSIRACNSNNKEEIAKEKIEEKENSIHEDETPIRKKTKQNPKNSQKTQNNGNDNQENVSESLGNPTLPTEQVLDQKQENQSENNGQQKDGEEHTDVK